jgi:hypothetical protein
MGMSAHDKQNRGLRFGVELTVCELMTCVLGRDELFLDAPKPGAHVTCGTGRVKPETQPVLETGLPLPQRVGAGGGF